MILSVARARGRLAFPALPHRPTYFVFLQSHHNMKRILLLVLAGFLATGSVAAQTADEAAIQQIVRGMQEGWNKKDGAAFIAGFAEQHDYVAIQGLYLPNTTRERNARAHQQLFETIHKETYLQLRVAKIKFLSATTAIVHVLGHTHPMGKPDEKRQELVISGVLQNQGGRWEIVAFQNTPVQPRPAPKSP
jgi:uncharacterized protein (TIGR02246 family)